MFGGHDGHEHQHHHHQQEQQNNPSDANHYKSQYEQCTLLLNMAIGNSDTPGGVPGILTVHSPTTAPAHGKPTKKSLNWARANEFASRGEDSSLARPPEN
jgi:hypothetical protein